MKKPAKRQAAQADRARQVAIEYCLLHYPTLYTAGIPRRLPAPEDDRWLVPVRLEDPGAEISAEVGEVRIAGDTGEVVAATALSEVIAGGEVSYQEQGNDRGGSDSSGVKHGVNRP